MGIGHTYAWQSPLQNLDPNDTLQDPHQYGLDAEEECGPATDPFACDQPSAPQVSDAADEVGLCLDDKENEELSGGEASDGEDDDAVDSDIEDDWVDEPSY